MLLYVHDATYRQKARDAKSRMTQTLDRRPETTKRCLAMLLRRARGCLTTMPTNQCGTMLLDEIRADFS